MPNSQLLSLTKWRRNRNLKRPLIKQWKRSVRTLYGNQVQILPVASGTTRASQHQTAGWLRPADRESKRNRQPTTVTRKKDVLCTTRKQQLKLEWKSTGEGWRRVKTWRSTCSTPSKERIKPTNQNQERHPMNNKEIYKERKRLLSFQRQKTSMPKIRNQRQVKIFCVCVILIFSTKRPGCQRPHPRTKKSVSPHSAFCDPRQ